ncbi:MAG TPA: AI-2E family transporter [Ktedonobacterales bacterium]|jgi:predicted PurR-regulated permease PerM|nr:AI-2E family transporter [Ktedonobacterales bacterium]
MGRDLLQRHRSLRLLVGLVIVALALHVIEVIWSALSLVGDVILMFLLAWIITFILAPVAALMQRRGIPRVAAVSLIYFTLLIVVAGGITLAIPALQAQISSLASSITTALSPANMAALDQSLVAALRQVGVGPSEARNLVDQLSSRLPALTSALAQNSVGIAEQLAASILTAIFDASLVVIISFYMMLDGARLVEGIVVRLPPAWARDVRLFQRYINDIFGGFFRAQLIIAAIYSAMTWLVLVILGLGDGALPVAILAGVLMLLPLIGVFLAIVPPVLLLLIQVPPSEALFRLVLLVFLLGAAQHVVLNLLAPRIFGHHMGIPTLLLFAALLLGAREGGVWGAFFAGPVVAVGYAMIEVIYDRWSATSPLFQPDDDQAGDEEAARRLNGNGENGTALTDLAPPAEYDEAARR